MKSYLTLLLAACAASAFSQQINVPKNKEFEIKRSIKDIGTYKTNEEYVYALKSLGKNAEGNSLFECKIVKVLIKDANASGGILLNTDSIRKTNFNNSAVLLPLAILNQPFRVTVSTKGKVLNISDRSELLKQRMEAWKIDPELQSHVYANAGGAFEASIQQLFLEFPDQKLAATSEWKPKNSDVPFKVISSKGGSMIIKSTKTEENGTMVDRKYVVNAQTGMVENSITISKGTYNGVVGAPANTVYNQTLMQKLVPRMVRKEVDTAWIDMAAKMSYWSEYFKTGNQYDSVKVHTLLKDYKNNRFANDPYFLVNRLQSVQHLDGDNAHKLYSKLLLEIPNELIKDTHHHLHNKLGTALSEQGAAESYAVSKYAVNTSSFDSWVQHSFAQGFLHYRDDEAAKIRRKKHYELAEMFHNTKDPVYQKKTNPLYLWAKVKAEKDDLPLLLTTATTFENMGDEEMKAGNGSRYSLLIYKMLLDANKKVEADSLLNKTIAKISRYAVDSLNKQRYEEQNMLAAAYYFKYTQATAAGSPNAMIYLSKAAQYSPKTNKEKAYASFYDRVFIDSKESYRQEFIDKLMAGGDEAQALSVFEDHISAEPDNLDQMRDLYVKKFPSKDFKAFFLGKIMSAWKPAPYFELTTLDGKQQKLENFKGKWLVMDFWGTWCGPCRAEMPEVNKFSQDVAAGKYDGVEFLSVACRDNEKSVKAYLDANKFSLPVAISEGKIERNYMITGYPSKILVAPDGRMMNVQFGKDWQKVLQQYSKMYAASIN